MIGIGGFLPILAQTAGLLASNFPEVCQNIITNSTQIAAVFGSSSNITSMHYLSGLNAPMCGAGVVPRCLGEWEGLVALRKKEGWAE